MKSPNVIKGIIAKLLKKAPYCSQELDLITQLVKVTRSIEDPDFFEPNTWILQEKGEATQVEISADLLAAWILHMSYGARTRMMIYEKNILLNIINNNFLVSATLVRAHMEAAAWATYSFNELIKATDKEDWSKLKKLIPMMLYGTAVYRECKHVPYYPKDPLWVECTNVMNAIDALDDYAHVCAGIKEKEGRLIYAILSDFAHPSIQGIRHMFRSVDEGENGWIISYKKREAFKKTNIQFLLRTLLSNMRIGYSAAAMIRLGIIEDRDDGVFFIKPSWDSARLVWDNIIKIQPTDVF